jgi:YgiT-type zinc finger domain-containing protein
MSNEAWKETFAQQKVTYVREQQGKGFIIEQVPARVCRETGERLFAPEAVERVQQIIWEQRKPTRMVETPVLEFAAAQGDGSTAPNSSADSSPNHGLEPTR